MNLNSLKKSTKSIEVLCVTNSDNLPVGSAIEFSASNGSLPGGGLLTTNGDIQHNGSPEYIGPSVNSLSVEEFRNGRMTLN